MINRCYKNNHEMIDVLPKLRVCECSAEGYLANLKGAVDEARRLIEAEGGYDVVRARLVNERTERLRKAKEDHANKLEKWHSAGTDTSAPKKTRARQKTLS